MSNGRACARIFLPGLAMPGLLMPSLVIAGVLLLVGCDTTSDPPITGTRVSVLSEAQTLRPDQQSATQRVVLPAPENVRDWPQVGGFPPHAMLHLTLGDRLRKVWSTDIGSGGGYRQALLTEPVIAGGRVYALDASATLTSVRLNDGGALWHVNLIPKDAEKGAFGGGVAFDAGSLYVTTGYAELIKLNASSGAIIWRHDLPAPVRGAPTVRAGRVLVITVSNEAMALNADDGSELWHHNGIEEAASIMGGTSPAVSGNTVIVPYSSGELFALRIENGTVLWTDSLSTVRRTDQIATLPDIHGLPVIDQNRVLAVSNADLLVSYDARTGQRQWEREVGSIQTPWLAGDFIYLVTNTPELVCFDAKTGQAVWVRRLPAWKNAKSKSDRIFWTGPVLASDRLIIASSAGRAMAISPYTGQLLGQISLPDGIVVPPVLADNTLIFLTNGGELVAYPLSRLENAMGNRQGGNRHGGNQPGELTVALLGRPNVGKSTLFNRLTGWRQAIVHDRPGVTRDRRAGAGGIADLSFTLIDTAGLEDADENSIAGRMRAQSEKALEEADLALFIIDARAGVTPLDMSLARELRASGKKILLVANKCEGKAGQPGLLDAYSLGLGDPVAISAEHGEGLDALYEALLPYITPDAEEEDEADENELGEDGAKKNATLDMVVVGRPNVGKSTLVNCLLGEDRMLTGPEPGLTRDAISHRWTHRGRALRLVDTAGMRRRARIDDSLEKMSVAATLEAVRMAHVVVLVLDAELGLDKQDLTIARLVAEEGRALVIVANKWDRIGNTAAMTEKLREKLDESFAQLKGLPVVPMSALTGRGVQSLMDKVIDTYAVWNKRISTSQLNRWLEYMVDTHPPPAGAGGKRLKLRYMTQVKSRPPTFVIFSQRAEEIPEAYQRYLINGLREEFKLPGVPIRLGLRKRDNPYVDEK